MLKQKQKLETGIEITRLIFNNINEVIEYIKINKINEQCIIPKSIFLSSEITGTKSFEQAMEYLKYGWEHKTKEIKRELKESFKTEKVVKTKNIYDVAGFQCSVPRYLQGVPDNMIRSKQVKRTEKVITIYKDISFSKGYIPKQIQKECVKVLQLINRLEKQNYRVKLNVVANSMYLDTGDKRNKIINIEICIKQSSQRLNLKQISFPLCNPSMLRRIILAVFERTEELNFEEFYKNYGLVISNDRTLKQIYKNKIIIPAEVQEKEIIDIEKYRLK